MTTKRKPTPTQAGSVLHMLQERFEAHMHRHRGITWEQVAARIDGDPTALAALQEMERTGGEPDVVACDASSGALLFVDCAAESPSGRRSLCYDEDARTSRKEHAPQTSAMEQAAAMGVELLTEDQYRLLQQLQTVDAKTSSWIATPPAVRALGGALFGDCRYGRVFIYHNGAQSYYAARGFRGALRV